MSGDTIEYDEPWIDVTFAANWANIGAFGLSDVQYRRERNQVVRLRGVAQAAAGAASTVFTIPAGFRPPANYIVPILNGAGLSTVGRLTIGTAGTMIVASFAAGEYASFDGVVYPITL